MLKAMQDKTMMGFAFFDKQGKQTTYPVRLEGLNAALAELDKIAKKKARRSLARQCLHLNANM
jgi:hypothetical protein